MASVILFCFACATAAILVSMAPNQEHWAAYYDTLPTQNETAVVDAAHQRAAIAKTAYTTSKGWFGACDESCAEKRTHWSQLDGEHNALAVVVHDKERRACAHLGIVNGLAMRDLLDLFGTRYANGVSNVMSEYWDSIRRSDNALEVLVLLLLFIPVFILVGVLGVGVAFVSAVFTVLVKYGILPEVPVYQLSLFALGLLCVYLVYLWVTGYFQVSDKGFFASQRDAAADGIVTVAVTVVGVLVLGAVGIANRMRR